MQKSMPTQAPAPLQVSLSVARMPSSQTVPLATGIVCKQTPARHSAVVQEFLSVSVQGVWSGFAGCSGQRPLGHATATAHSLGDDLIPTQTPARQTSPRVSELPSSQGVLSSSGRLSEHTPFAHVPARWHWLFGLQTTLFTRQSRTPTHLPSAVHASKSVAGFPSSQASPTGDRG